MSIDIDDNTVACVIQTHNEKGESCGQRILVSDLNAKTQAELNKMTKTLIENAHLRGKVLAHTIDFNLVRHYITGGKRTSKQILEFLDKVEGK